MGLILLSPLGSDRAESRRNGRWIDKEVGVEESASEEGVEREEKRGGDRRREEVIGGAVVSKGGLNRGWGFKPVGT